MKHYQDGRLATGHINDPEQDARLVFDVLDNQLEAFAALHQSNPDALTCYHYLTTRAEGMSGFDAVFAHVRGRDCPTEAQTTEALTCMLAGQVCGARLAQTLDRLSSPKNG